MNPNSNTALAIPVNDSRRYFAAMDPNKLIGELETRIEDYNNHLIATGRAQLWATTYAFYNQGVYKDGCMNRTGEQGEYTEIYVNHFRNILTHMLVMTTNQRPSLDARAANSDFKSQAQTIVANGILEYYDEFKGLDEIGKQAVEDCLVFGDAYVYQGWDFALGAPMMKDPNNPEKIIKEGDVLFKNFTPLDVIVDIKGGKADGACQWYCVRDFQNKWDLIERYPELRDKILRHTSDPKYTAYSGLRSFKTDSDFIPVYIFMHDRTDAMPDGRFFTYLGKDCWFVDSELPPFYKSLPIKRLCASKQRATAFGYSIAYDLAPLQEAINGIYSTVITNQSTFGVQNILMPTGANIDVVDLADGLKMIQYDPKAGKPEGLNLTTTPKEIFEFMGRLEAVMETISGVNSVARGNPEESLKSGTALALVQSMAIQFMSGLQQSYAKLLAALGTGLIEILQACATTPRIIEIAGKNNRSYVKEFTSKDISQISRVTVDLGNPVARTLAGKVNMAENLLKNNLIDTADQYIQVLTTGKLEPLIEGKQSELMLIRSENEAMSEGKPIQAVMFDNHPLHVMEHKCVLASPEARQDPTVVKAVLTHIMDHIQQWKTADPSLLQMLGEPLPPPPPMPAPMPGAGGPAPANSAELVNSNPVVAKADKVRPAGLPKNPLENQIANQNGGTH